MQKYTTIFEGRGKLKDFQVKLHINENIKPIIQPQRRLPYHLRKEVSKELRKLEDQDIIERVENKPIPWISPIVCTPKKDGGLRICVDMREANIAIERERHLMPTIQDFKTEVKVFLSLYYAPFLISLSSFPVVFVEGPHFCSEDCMGS